MSAAAWLWLALAYLAWVTAASAVAAGLIAWDKRRAERGGWRVPEATLHLWEFLGGWPGAVWARRRCRHKTHKRSYVWAARGMAWLHILAVMAAGTTLTWLG